MNAVRHNDIAYCPRCAGNDLIWHSRKNFECRACGFMLYLNVAAAVAVIIESEGKILFGIRKNEPGRGLLDLPGGFVDPGESAEECARREVLEETGIVLSSATYFESGSNTYLYRGIVYDTLDVVLTAAFPVVPTVRAGDDLADALWIDRTAVDYDRIAFPSLREAVRRYVGETGM